ncbi:MAG TPA: LURP-one-related family protein [Candidatus Bathyarchaeia archaeon]|nr:LURP-one-related family protein [Candidatus Bathyarchaeia archaeon]
MTSSPTCTSCGQALIPGSRFCGRCGAPAAFHTQSSQFGDQVPRWDNPFRGTQYIIDQKILAIRDTFGIKDASGNLLAYVKQQLVSFGPKFWYEGTDGTRLGEIHGKVLAIRPTFEIYNTQGRLLAVIKKKILQLIGSQWWMENSSGQEIAKIHGNILEHDYKVQSPDGTQIAQVHKKWVSVRDSYCVEIQNPSFDPFLVLSYAISMDHAEKKEDHH